jgi:hypothetical protein
VSAASRGSSNDVGFALAPPLRLPAAAVRAAQEEREKSERARFTLASRQGKAKQFKAGTKSIRSLLRVNLFSFASLSSCLRLSSLNFCHVCVALTHSHFDSCNQRQAEEEAALLCSRVSSFELHTLSLFVSLVSGFYLLECLFGCRNVSNLLDRSAGLGRLSRL